MSHFSLPVQIYKKSYCSDPSIGVSKMLTFYVKVFYEMGKARSGELSCMWTGFVVLVFPEF